MHVPFQFYTLFGFAVADRDERFREKSKEDCPTSCYAYFLFVVVVVVLCKSWYFVMRQTALIS
jgi:hypothetical protein